MNTHHTLLYLLLVIGMANSPFAYGQRAIFLLRHAERLEYESTDGPLSESGTARAERLANLLKDAGVTAIFTSDRQRLAEILDFTSEFIVLMKS